MKEVVAIPIFPGILPSQRGHTGCSHPCRVCSGRLCRWHVDVRAGLTCKLPLYVVPVSFSREILPVRRGHITPPQDQVFVCRTEHFIRERMKLVILAATPKFLPADGPFPRASMMSISPEEAVSTQKERYSNQEGDEGPMEVYESQTRVEASQENAHTNLWGNKGDARGETLGDSRPFKRNPSSSTAAPSPPSPRSPVSQRPAPRTDTLGHGIHTQTLTTSGRESTTGAVVIGHGVQDGFGINALGRLQRLDAAPGIVDYGNCDFNAVLEFNGILTSFSTPIQSMMLTLTATIYPLASARNPLPHSLLARLIRQIVDFTVSDRQLILALGSLRSDVSFISRFEDLASLQSHV
ncbi:hypothetical protein BDZ89DRAFT_1036128 [Hymenopellis radicata]|nr:hypothetical protein BDZ89DRAFT_1036128 [Hymenopellis radicata]